MNIEKKELRKAISLAKKGLSPESKLLSSEIACRSLMSDPHVLYAPIIAAYWPLQDEIDVRPVIRWAVASGKTVYLPVMNGDDLDLRVFSGEDLLNSDNSYHVSQPVDAPLISNTTGLGMTMIIPGMAFDSLGNRLGRGRGFYDRMLKRFPAAYKIGVAFSVQHAPSVPIGLMDVPMDSVLFA